ncbi:hypothetical protein GW7_01016 [Heterocephalus glaber]|uniref:Uncharacterized protein n=1 Tax=Heterocephalus glaber TaxID=10181 RepID=G5B1Z9_HETGA|nr:hypothetical protein GW7_01016 [Heterocephalus glaber]
MHLPDDSQWDEAICDLAVCPHPQCWAAVRRIERGHPRILSSPCKTPLDAEDKHPVLTIVNISDSCFQAKKLAHQQSPEFAFTKVHSLLSRGSKLASKFQVLNLNETQLPCSEDVRHMVVIWIPEESEKNMWLLPQGEKNMSCVEMKIQLGRMKKSLPLEKNRHDSVISSKMFLTIHCLTLQRPVLRYPEHLKKLHHSLKREGHRKQQQWRQPQGKKEKTPTKQQEAKEKAKSDLKIQNTPNKHSAAVAYNPVCGSKMSKKELPCKDLSASVEMVLEAPIANQEKIPGDLSESMAKPSWKPELKPLRILQATDVEEEENQSSRSESEDSLDTD